jgi:hypothetical protein
MGLRGITWFASSNRPYDEGGRRVPSPPLLAAAFPPTQHPNSPIHLLERLELLLRLLVVGVLLLVRVQAEGQLEICLFDVGLGGVPSDPQHLRGKRKSSYLLKSSEKDPDFQPNLHLKDHILCIEASWILLFTS